MGHRISEECMGIPVSVIGNDTSVALPTPAVFVQGMTPFIAVCF